ncbi:ATP-binding protein [Kitasatospora sp. NPDC058965]|uniref:ATP-binding protein n=1 Tax=Kitasatospora sp. NPDC058965 TaxID=3346682 RepID=UPI003679290E
MEREYRPERDEFHVTAGAGAVRGARDRVVAVAERWRLPLSRDALEDLRLCTSEVVANALEHAGGQCEVTVSWGGRRLLVEVADRSPRAPVPLAAGDELPFGRGLVLVAALAGSWGWRPTATGKVVHFGIVVDPVVAGATGSARPGAVTVRR